MIYQIPTRRESLNLYTRNTLRIGFCIIQPNNFNTIRDKQRK